MNKQTKLLKAFVITMSTVFFTGCPSVGVTIDNLPTKFSDNECVEDIFFGKGSLQKLDIYYPAPS